MTTAQAIPVLAQGAGCEVLAGRLLLPGAPAPPPPRTLLFDGAAATLGRGAYDEELCIQGCRWVDAAQCCGAEASAATGGGIIPAAATPGVTTPLGSTAPRCQQL